jgi:hypothetical protein
MNSDPEDSDARSISFAALAFAAALDTLDRDKVLKKARRWFADVIGAALRGHVDILLRKMGPK